MHDKKHMIKGRAHQVASNALSEKNDDSQKKDESLKIIINIPNILTFLRILLAPFFMIFLLNDKFLVAFIILLIASITDFLDGRIARRFNMQTQFGRLLDPIADKILIFVSMVALMIKFHFPLWIGIIIILRDLLIVCGGIVIISKKKQRYISPSILGKISTAFQLTSVLVYILASLNEYYSLWIDILLYLTVVITVLSGLNYALTGYLILKLSDSAEEIVKEVITPSKTIKKLKNTSPSKKGRNAKNRNEKKHKKK